jgi:hypothetical protein
MHLLLLREEGKVAGVELAAAVRVELLGEGGTE